MPMAQQSHGETLYMSRQPRILVYGRDLALLETRRLVLESKQEPVAATTDLLEACRYVEVEQPELLILCYTLSELDRASILTVVEQIRPGMKVLVLEADGPPAPHSTPSTLNIFSGPRVLRAKVCALLTAP